MEYYNLQHDAQLAILQAEQTLKHEACHKMELDLNEKQTALRQKRLEQKDIQIKMTKDRVAKFAKLISMTFNAKTGATDEEKYGSLK